APDCGSGGSGFETRQPPHLPNSGLLLGSVTFSIIPPFESRTGVFCAGGIYCAGILLSAA
ncbi:MAG: hypothetical protein VW039_02895, partial [Halieaceae bacterium]